MNLTEATILVTGGASGLGQTMVHDLAGQGAMVLVLDRDEKALRDSCQEPRIQGRVCDITHPGEVQQTVAELWKEYGPIHGVINNAGILYSAPLLSIQSTGLELHRIDDWKKVMDVNLNGVFYVTMAAASLMVKSRVKGVVVNISSVSSGGNIGQGAYSATKAGVEALTVVWAKELGPWGIRVACLAPGFNETPSTRAAIPEEILEDVRTETPIRRLGKPEEIAHGIRFIFENEFVNGTTIRIDGGFRL
jgi:3-oxoacyl-[acyl-carrier protein] reductase